MHSIPPNIQFLPVSGFSYIFMNSYHKKHLPSKSDMSENIKQHSQMGSTPGLGWNSACRLAALTEDSVACLSPCRQMPKLLPQDSQMGSTPGLGWNSACRLAALTGDSVSCFSPFGQMPELLPQVS